MTASSTENTSRPRLPLRFQREIVEIAEARGVSPTEVLRAAIERGLLSMTGVVVLPPPPVERADDKNA